MKSRRYGLSPNRDFQICARRNSVRVTAPSERNSERNRNRQQAESRESKLRCASDLSHRARRPTPIRPFVQAVAFGRTEAAHRAVTRRIRMALVHGRDAAGPQGVSDNAWSSLRAAPKLPSW